MTSHSSDDLRSVINIKEVADDIIDTIVRLSEQALTPLAGGRYATTFKESCAMLVTIPSDLEAFIQAEVASGKYASADEAVSEAVRLLQERERHLESLRGEIEIGLSASERGEVTAIRTDADRQALIDDVQRRGRERLPAARGRP